MSYIARSSRSGRPGRSFSPRLRAQVIVVIAKNCWPGSVSFQEEEGGFPAFLWSCGMEVAPVGAWVLALALVSWYALEARLRRRG